MYANDKQLKIFLYTMNIAYKYFINNKKTKALLREKLIFNIKHSHIVKS